MGGTEWCKGRCHGNVQGSVRTQDALCAKRRGWDPSGIKTLESLTLQAEARQTEAGMNAWMLLKLRALDWPGEYEGWNSASHASEADLHGRDRQCGLKTVSCEKLCYVCEPAFCWAWLHINKRGITKVCRLLLGPSPAEGSPLHPSASLLPSFPPFSCSPQHAAHVHPIQKRKKTLSSAFPPVCLRSISLHSPSKYRRGKKMHQNTDKLFRFVPQREKEKNAWLCSLKEKGRRREGREVRNKNCIRYKIPQSACDIKN